MKSDWLKLFNNKHLSDIEFHYKSDCYHGHKIVVCAASELFQKIFQIGKELNTEGSLSKCHTKRLNYISRKSINKGAVAAIRSIDDK